MAENVLETLFGEIAKAIRSKTGDTATMKPNEFPAKISEIESSNVMDNVEISLDFTNGNQTERLPDGYSANSVTIFKPENLTPENIAEGVEIAGIVGTYVIPQYDGTVDITESETATLISFTINGTEHQAVEGMTWAEWCDSEYNTVGADCDDGTMVHYTLTSFIVGVSESDTIIDGNAYTLAVGGGRD